MSGQIDYMSDVVRGHYPDADLSEFIHMSAEDGMNIFDMSIKTDLERDVSRMTITSRTAYNDLINLKYSEILDPRKNDDLNKPEMFEKLISPEYDWDDGPKIKFLKSYMEQVGDEICQALPYDIDIFRIVEPSIMYAYIMATKD